MSKTSSDTLLIQAAQIELIKNHGHIEMLAVAKSAGVSVGNAYHHFGSKTGLIAAVVDNFYQPIQKIMLDDKTSKDIDWVTREKKRTLDYIDYYYNHPFSSLLVGRLGREPEVFDIENSHMQELLRAGAKNLVNGQKQGVISLKIKPEVAIAIILGGIRQVLIGVMLSGDLPDRNMLLEEIWIVIGSALGIEKK